MNNRQISFKKNEKNLINSFDYFVSKNSFAKWLFTMKIKIKFIIKDLIFEINSYLPKILNFVNN